MYIFTTLEFPTHNIDFHLLTASENAKYYYLCQMSGFKYRSVVAAMNTRTYKSAIMGTHFLLKGNGHPQSSYIEVQ